MFETVGKESPREDCRSVDAPGVAGEPGAARLDSALLPWAPSPTPVGCRESRTLHFVRDTIRKRNCSAPFFVAATRVSTRRNL